MRRIGAAAAFALAALGAFVASMLHRTGGAWSLPIDDGFIYLQYARRLAEGHPFSYSPGAPPSTGVTSWAHTLLLAPAWWVGLRDASACIWSLGLGAAYLAASLVLVARLARALVPSRPGWAAFFALLLVAGDGHALWSAFSGMDTWLFAVGMLVVLALVAARGPAPGVAWIAAALLAWIRPEGTVLGALALVALAVAAGPRAPGVVRVGAPAALILAAPSIGCWLLTGTTRTDTFAVKSVFGIPAWSGRSALLAQTPETAWVSIDRYLRDFESLSSNGLLTFWSVLTGALLVAGLLQGFRGRAGVAGVVASIWLLASIALSAVAVAGSARYLFAYLPILALLQALGAAAVADALGRWSRVVRVAIPAIAAPLLAASLAVRIEDYGWNCENTEHQQVRVGRWLDEHAPADARIAVNDAGGIGYYSHRRILDLVGLVSHGWSEVFHSRPAATYEELVALPDAERPRYLAIYDDWFPDLAATSFLGAPVFEALLERNTVCGGNPKRVYEPSWPTREELARASRPSAEVAGTLAIVDAVNVGELASEKEHDYEILVGSWPLLRELPRGADRKLVDGGRMHLGGERMRVRLKPGVPLRIAVRTESELEGGFSCELRMDGEAVGVLRGPSAPGRWSELTLDVPAARVTSARPLVESRVDSGRFATYRWWFLQ
ncbi:MAG TPA: hypothetical protein VKE69_09340 [Planctomycetota bacterium]|nr:hypothetical protein [Planctomycetota bacterium]